MADQFALAGVWRTHYWHYATPADAAPQYLDFNRPADEYRIRLKEAPDGFQTGAPLESGPVLEPFDLGGVAVDFRLDFIQK
jgi:hypothetical protein